MKSQVTFESKNRMTQAIGCLAMVLIGLSVADVQSAVIQQANTSSVTELAVNPTDLINAGQASLASVSSTNPATEYGSAGISAVNNGVGGIGAASCAYTDNRAFTVTFTLKTSTYTLGYDITSVETFAAWPAAVDVQQQYELLYSTVGSDSFTSLGTFVYDNATVNYSRIALTSSDGLIATGVDQVRFAFTGVGALGCWTELDVQGIATIPEPTACALLLMGGVFAVIRRPRNTKGAGR